MKLDSIFKKQSSPSTRGIDMSQYGVGGLDSGENSESGGVTPNTSSFKGNTGSIKEQIAAKESRGEKNPYRAFNSAGGGEGAVGKYQFRWKRWKPEIEKVTGIKTAEEFMNNPQAQEDYMDYHLKNHNYPFIQDVKKYDKNGLSESDISKLIHFRGVEGAKEYVQGDLNQRKESYNMTGNEYLGRPKHALGAVLPLVQTGISLVSSVIDAERKRKEMSKVNSLRLNEQQQMIQNNSEAVLNQYPVYGDFRGGFYRDGGKIDNTNVKKPVSILDIEKNKKSYYQKQLEQNKTYLNEQKDVNPNVKQVFRNEQAKKEANDRINKRQDIVNNAALAASPVPVVGEILGAASGIANGVVDLAQGEYGNAALSAIPYGVSKIPFDKLGSKYLPNAYKTNPFANKGENGYMDLMRIQEKNDTPLGQQAREGKLSPAWLNTETTAKRYDVQEKHFGEWFTNDKSDIDWYKNDRNFKDPEIINLKVPKEIINDYSVKKIPTANELSFAHDREFIIPKNEQKKFQPHWLKGYKKQSGDTIKSDERTGYRIRVRKDGVREYDTHEFYNKFKKPVKDSLGTKTYAQGGNIPQYEVESGEVVQGDAQLESSKKIASDLHHVTGATHEEGGVIGQGGERVFSNRLNIPVELLALLRKSKIKADPLSTYADVAVNLGKMKGKFESKLGSYKPRIVNTGKLMLERVDGLLDMVFNTQEQSKLPVFANGGIIDRPTPEKYSKEWLANWYKNRKIPLTKEDGNYPNELLKKELPKILNNINTIKYEKDINSDIFDGKYTNDKHTIQKSTMFRTYPDNEQNSINLHELTHASELHGRLRTPNYNGAIIEENLPPKEKSKDKYYNYYRKPEEVHARIMQLRAFANFQPDEVVTEEHLNNVLNYIETKKGSLMRHETKRGLLDVFGGDKKKLLKVLNLTTDNKQMNKNIFAKGGMLPKYQDGGKVGNTKTKKYSDDWLKNWNKPKVIPQSMYGNFTAEKKDLGRYNNVVANAKKELPKPVNTVSKKETPQTVISQKAVKNTEIKNNTVKHNLNRGIIKSPTIYPEYPTTGSKYTVKKGDWLSSIADKFGKNYMDIAYANKIKNPDLIKPGQVLSIPDRYNAENYMNSPTGFSDFDTPDSIKVGNINSFNTPQILSENGRNPNKLFDTGVPDFSKMGISNLDGKGFDPVKEKSGLGNKGDGFSNAAIALTGIGGLANAFINSKFDTSVKRNLMQNPAYVYNDRSGLSQWQAQQAYRTGLKSLDLSTSQGTQNNAANMMWKTQNVLSQIHNQENQRRDQYNSQYADSVWRTQAANTGIVNQANDMKRDLKNDKLAGYQNILNNTIGNVNTILSERDARRLELERMKLIGDRGELGGRGITQYLQDQIDELKTPKKK